MVTLRERDVILRPPERTDVATRLAAGQDPEFLYMLGGDRARSTPTLTTSQAEAWYERMREREQWIIEWQSHAVGNAGFSHSDPENRNATYAIVIWDKTARHQGIGTAVTRAVVRHAFEDLGLHRLDLRVLDYNHVAIRCYQRCGFRHEGTEAETVFIDGVWHNDLRMRLLEQEYRELAQP